MGGPGSGFTASSGSRTGAVVVVAPRRPPPVDGRREVLPDETMRQPLRNGLPAPITMRARRSGLGHSGKGSTGRPSWTGSLYARQIMAAIHVAPLAELLPRVPLAGPVPQNRLPLAFTRAYLGSSVVGEMLGAMPNVTHILCGHTHVHRDASSDGQVRINIGSDYLRKRFELIELPD